mmetsp:Transcript_41928/g.50285  ORF Transcript_41928/g.50285 Transcript_41928/m.50285 type:complete len:997 (+) Transcript_41928:168-3158(+)
MRFTAAITAALLCASVPQYVSAKAIMGIDLGSFFMKVALVQRNSPLEIVTNLHSKRKTEQMVLFDQGSRFYGADASSLLGRKPQLTPSGMSVCLGRDENHPNVKVLESLHHPITPTFNETRKGLCFEVAKASYTPEELVAMVLNHAKEISGDFGEMPPPRDCVLTVPSFATQHERSALLDSAELANLNVLSLIEENTAAGLQYGMDRIDEEPINVMFYNMGATSTQVSIMTYLSYERKDSKYSKAKTVGGFEVKGKGWDSTLGGDIFSAVLVDYMVEEFNTALNKARGTTDKDVRSNLRAMTKLRIQANKVKQVLSANSDIPVYIDALFDDMPLSTHISRAKFEELSHDLLKRAVVPIQKALDSANMTLADINSIEMIGGGMRVPSLQAEVKKSMGDMTLGMHINSDESMALGAAFHGANVSTSFRVRHVGMADMNPFGIAIELQNLEEAKKKGIFGKIFGGNKGDKAKKAETKDDDEKDGEDEEEWSKNAVIFKPLARMGVTKTIAFSHDRDVHLSIDYSAVENNPYLPEGTDLPIARFNITGINEFANEKKELGKPKVTLKFEMTSGGLVNLIKAEAIIEEMVIVQEEVEVEDEDQDDNETNETVAKDGEETTESDAEKKEEGAAGEEEVDGKKDDADREKIDNDEKGDVKEDTVDASDADDKKADDAGGKAEDKIENDEKKKTKKKKMKKIMVDKEKKKVHKQALMVNTYYVGKTQPYSEATMEESTLKLQALADADAARIELEEAKNKVESYIYRIKNKLIDDEELVAKVTNEEQRTSLSEMATTAEDWMYEDGYDAGLDTFEKKYKELSEPAEVVWYRMSELTDRPAAVAALRQKLTKIEDLMTKWETSMPQITEGERSNVLEKVNDVRKWVDDMEDKQNEVNPWDVPVLISSEVPIQTKDVEKMIGKLSKRPKPKPPKVEKNETNEEIKVEEEENSDDKNSEKTDEPVKDAEKKSEADDTDKTEDVEKNDDDQKTEDVKKEDGETPGEEL